MAGELWREQVRVAKETTYGTAVSPATRKLYLRDVSLTRERDSRVHRFATGTRDNVRAHTQGPVIAGGSAAMSMSADELLEWLLVTIKGGVTPTTPSGATNARLWTFTPNETLDSMTLERNDGARLQRATGVRGNQMTIAGSVGGDNAVTIEMFAKTREDAYSALTGSLSDRVPTFMEGWQTNFFIDSFGGTPGSGLITGSLLNWNIVINNNLGRKFTAANTLSPTGQTVGQIDITANLLLEAANAQAASELANWDADTKRLLRLEFLGPANEIETGASEVQTLTASGPPTAGTFTLTYGGQTTGAIAYNASAAVVQAALEALTNIGSGNVLGGGGPLPGTPVTITFQGALATTDVPLMTVNNAGLTGGTVAAATTTAGRSGRRYVTIDIPGAWTTPDVNQADEGTRAWQFPFQYVYDSVLAAGLQIRVQTDRTTAFA
jgi:hypothetical protein